MRKKVNWWWVVATHENGRVCSEELNAMGMKEYADWHAAARIFASKRMAEAWIRRVKLLNSVPKGIELQALSDEAWEFTIIMYHRGKQYGLSLL